MTNIYDKMIRFDEQLPPEGAKILYAYTDEDDVMFDIGHFFKKGSVVPFIFDFDCDEFDPDDPICKKCDRRPKPHISESSTVYSPRFSEDNFSVDEFKMNCMDLRYIVLQEYGKK